VKNKKKRQPGKKVTRLGEHGVTTVEKTTKGNWGRNVHISVFGERERFQLTDNTETRIKKNQGQRGRKSDRNIRTYEEIEGTFHKFKEDRGNLPSVSLAGSVGERQRT